MIMHDYLVIQAVDPRLEEATNLVHLLTAELAKRYNFVDDGSGNFKTEDVLVPNSVFLIGRVGKEAVACGALRPLESGIAEIKRMFVISKYRGHGYGKIILHELEKYASQFDYFTVWLETGELQPEAINLYQRSGYSRIPSFGIYVNSKRSVCFEKQVSL